MGNPLSKDGKEKKLGDVDIEFGHQKLQISKELTLENCLQLCILLSLCPADTDKVERSASPGVALLQILEERDMYGEDNCQVILKALTTIGMHRLVAKLQSCDRTLDYPSLNEKRRTLVDCLKIRYRDIYRYRSGVGLSENAFIDLHLILQDPGMSRRSENQCIKLSSYLDIFTNPVLRREKRIIVEGEAGFGKTTLAIQLAYSWSIATKKSPLSSIDVLVFLQMANVKHFKSVYDAIKALLPIDCPLTAEDIREVVQRSSDALIALDGWDEFICRAGQSDKESDFHHIAQNQMLTNSRVVITARPSCPAIREYPARRLRLQELKNNQRQTYIREIYPKHPEVATDFISFIEENDFLRSLCGVPILFQIFLNSFMDDIHIKRDDISLNRVTVLFQSALTSFTDRKHSQREVSPERLQPHPEDLEKLCKIASDGLCRQSSETMWKRDVFNEFQCLEFWTNAGILISENEEKDSIRPLTSFDGPPEFTHLRFLHAMFQEWFAAQYLSKLALRDLDGFMEYLQQLNPTQLVSLFPFICGLESFATTPVIEFLLSLKDEWPFPIMDFMCQCFYEHDGDKAHLRDLIARVCQKPVSIHSRDSRMLQNAKIALLVTASEYEIPIAKVNIVGVVKAFDGEGAIFKSGLRLPPLLTAESFVIIGYKLRTHPTCDEMLRYAAKSTSLERAWFYYKCWKLPSIHTTVSSLALHEETKVFLFNGKKWFILDLSEGKWLKQVEGKAKRNALGDTFLLDTYVLD